jgi:DNA replication and repair protein RecF
LLDDIFDKLDKHRVKQIVRLVADDHFGQIFITDTNREHLDQIIHEVAAGSKIFQVNNGTVKEASHEKK